MNDRGSTLPLILGIVVIALVTAAAAVAAGDAFVQQRGLQNTCDGAAVAAAASAVDLARDRAVGDAGTLRLGDVQAAVSSYVARDLDRRTVIVDARLSPDGRTVAVTCTQREHIAFGAVFGKAAGVRHVVHSSAQAPLVGGQ